MPHLQGKPHPRGAEGQKDHSRGGVETNRSPQGILWHVINDAEENVTALQKEIDECYQQATNPRRCHQDQTMNKMAVNMDRRRSTLKAKKWEILSALLPKKVGEAEAYIRNEDLFTYMQANQDILNRY